jgi:hypothetical protein
MTVAPVVNFPQQIQLLRGSTSSDKLIKLLLYILNHALFNFVKLNFLLYGPSGPDFAVYDCSVFLLLRHGWSY